MIHEEGSCTLTALVFCEAWLYEELRFTLRSMEQAYLDSYGTETGTITFHLGGFTVDHEF